MSTYRVFEHHVRVVSALDPSRPWAHWKIEVDTDREITNRVKEITRLAKRRRAQEDLPTTLSHWTVESTTGRHGHKNPAQAGSDAHTIPAQAALELYRRQGGEAVLRDADVFFAEVSGSVTRQSLTEQEQSARNKVVADLAQDAQDLVRCLTARNNPA